MEQTERNTSEIKFRNADVKRYSATMNDGSVRNFDSLEELMQARQDDNENR